MQEQHPNRPTMLDLSNPLEASIERARRDEAVFAIEREAKTLRVPMTHVARDPEYLEVLDYRIGQELTRAEQRVAALRNLRARVARAGVQS